VTERRDGDPVWADFDGSFEATRRRQVRLGLQLDHAARLRWLEERMTELIRLKGTPEAPKRSGAE